MVVFMLLVSEYYYRFSVGRPIRPDESYRALSRQYPSGRAAMHPKLKLMSFGLGLATLFLFIRFVPSPFSIMSSDLSKSHASI